MEENDVKRKLKVYNSTNYKRVSNEFLDKCLSDYFQTLDFLSEVTFTGENEMLCSIFDSISEMLLCIIRIHYEKETIKTINIPYKDILKKNKEYIIKLKERIDAFGDKEHVSLVDSVNFRKMEKAYAEYNLNTISGLIYRSPYEDKLASVRKFNSKASFTILTNGGINLGTKNISKKPEPNVNSHTAETYYKIISEKKYRDNFIAVLDGELDLKDALPEIQMLLVKYNDEELDKLRHYITNRNIIVEMMLLVNIINANIYYYDIETLKSYYDEEELQEIGLEAEYIVDEGIENMYLNLRLDL